MLLGKEGLLMYKILLIGSGGAIGALLRYGVAGVVSRHIGGTFPWGTLSVNSIGALLIGLLWGIFEQFQFSDSLRVFLFIGILGAFTTFSTFCLESVNLIKNGEIKYALAYIFSSNILGILFVIFGFFISRLIIGKL